MLANAYNPYVGEEEKKHREPGEIFAEIKKHEKKLQDSLNQLKRIIA